METKSVKPKFIIPLTLPNNDIITSEKQVCRIELANINLSDFRNNIPWLDFVIKKISMSGPVCFRTNTH